MSVPSAILQYTLNNKDLLPAGYTPLAYIESTGTLWINTGIYPTSNFCVNTKVYITDINYNAERGIFGNYSSSTGIAFGYYNKLLYWGARTTSGWKNLSYVQNKSNMVEIQYNASTTNSSLITSEGNVSSTSIIYDFTSTNSCAIFKPHSSDNSASFIGRIYYLNIIQQNVLIGDYRPARRDSDGVIGMYDLVSRTFKTNSGSGSFIAGPELAVGKGGGKSLPEEYLLVEWLLNINKTEYISINRTVKSNTVMKVNLAVTAYKSGVYNLIMGYAASTSWTPYTLGISTSNVICTYGGTCSISGTPPSSFTTVTWTSTNSSETSGSTLGLFKATGSPGDTSYPPAQQKISYAEILEGTTLLYKLFPCYRKSDMKPGMYDTVNGVFYTNAGSGEFILGPSINAGYTCEVNARGKNLYPYSTTRTFTTGSGHLLNRIENLGFNGVPGPWTISFDGYASSNINLSGDICDCGGKTIALTTTKQHYYITATAVSYYWRTLYNGFWDMESNTQGVTVYLSNIMMTLSNLDLPYVSPNTSGLYTNVSSVYDSSKGWVADLTSSSRYITATIPNLGNNFSVVWWELSSEYNGGTMPWGIGNFNPLYSKCLNNGDGTNNPWYKPGTTTAIDNITNNTWHHFVVTGNGTNNFLYVDGIKYGLSKTFKPLSSTSLRLNSWPAGNYYRNPKISNFLIFNVALTDAQVKELYGK